MIVLHKQNPALNFFLTFKCNIFLDDFNRSQSLRIVTTKRRNVATLQIEPKSDQSAGDKLSQIQELLHEELEPLTVLCKALRLPEVSVFCLDKFLADKCSNFKMFDPLKSLSLGDNLAEKRKSLIRSQSPFV